MLEILRVGSLIIMTHQFKRLNSKHNYLIDNNYKGKSTKQKEESSNKNKKFKDKNYKGRKNFMNNLK